MCAELQSVKLLAHKPRLQNPFTLATFILTGVTMAVTALVAADSLRAFYALDTADRVMNYAPNEIEAYQKLGMEVPELGETIWNILHYHPVAERYTSVRFILLIPVAVGIVLKLIDYWVPAVRASVAFRRTFDPKQAAYAYVIPDDSVGRPCILRIRHSVVGLSCEGTLTFKQTSFFHFQQRKYICTGEKCLPVSHALETDNVNYATVLASAEQGLTLTQYKERMEKYGENRMVAPVLSLGALFVEHIMSPMFMFQVFTSILWLFDKFAIFSCMTTLTLLFMEGGNILTQYNSLRESRRLIAHPTLVNVRRNDEPWKVISSADLVPGDLVRFVPTDLQKAIKADKENKARMESDRRTRETRTVTMPAFQTLVLRMVRKFLDSAYPSEDLKIARAAANSFTNSLVADMVVTRGTAIVDESLLTGESTVQIKDSIHSSDLLSTNDPKDVRVNLDRDANHILYAGTQLVSVGTGSGLDSDAVEAIVLRTGFETAQGQLIRKILFSDERSGGMNRDSYIFLGIMAVIACMAAVHTFVRGYRTHISAISKLILESLIVFVSVIPPELPMEISMILSTSLQELRKVFIYCTEPIKVMNAGKLQVCCFDKTGTLCSDEVELEGVVMSGTKPTITAFSKISMHGPLDSCEMQVHLALAAAQSLFLYENQLFGDPFERSVYASNTCYKLSSNTRVVVECPTGPLTVDIIKRHAFSSQVKRMSVVCTVTGSNPMGNFIFCKGAPEVIADLCLKDSLPTWYNTELTRLTKRGCRVLSLASKPFTGEIPTRAGAENDLRFLGFVVADAKLKEDTTEAIKIIRGSSHRCVTISGDNIVNVSVISRSCGIIEEDQAIYQLDSYDSATGKCTFTFLDTLNEGIRDTASSLDLFPNTVSGNVQKCALAVTNSDTFVALMSHPSHSRAYIPHITVFARVTPEQKAAIVRLMQETAPTLFCGDGSNDAEGLRVADVGVALMETPDYQDLKAEAEREAVNPGESRMLKVQRAISELKKPTVLGPNGTPASQQMLYTAARDRAAARGTNLTDELRFLTWEHMNYWQSVRKITAKNSFVDKIFGLSNDGIMSGWNQALEIEEDGQDLQLGDAAIAAPFTAKSGTLSGVLSIIRQGRCSLVTLLMTYKTLALKCIVGAHSMSVLTLDGVRFSEAQLVASEVAQLYILFNINKAKPLHVISPVPAPRSIISAYGLTSMFVQALIHVLTTTIACRYATSERTTVALETTFSPNRLNTVVFLLSLFQDLSISVVNYPGEPYMQSIHNFTKLRRGILIFLVVILFLTSQAFPDINDALGLIRLAIPMQRLVALLGVLDVALCYAAEKLAFILLGPRVPQ
ncbi:putative Cation-transporting ATPase 2 [Giardia muris]|uniref:Putative Cation-transporting ATPase 2 n=1 Tax=Giardia muris TaxID=5742 RepID=A0A4Z1SQN2_GIAMU|nr:putative Cation-transporting ATPase 2 [Giardia muris]|eukprot:TNJ28162.1 putative Cation-transporting ATPase 2 [Giardia muris]